MPRLFHRPPKYGLHKGTKQAIVCHQGRMIYLGPYGSEKSHRKYQEFLDQWHALRHEQPLPEGKQSADEVLVSSITPQNLRLKWRQGMKVSINELIFVYRQHAKEYYQKNGKVTREAELIVQITTLLGKKHGLRKADDFGPVDLDNFRDELIDDHDWSRKFINKQIVRTIAMFKWAAKKEICSPKVHAGLAALGGLKKGRTKARETQGVTTVEDAIVEQTLARLPEIVADMVRFQRLTSARPGEVCSVRPEDVDRTGDVWLYRPESHKTEHHEQERIIPLGPKAQEIISPYLLRPADSYCFSPSESVERKRCRQMKSNGSVADPRRSNGFAVSEGKADRYQVASYRNAIRRACNQLSLPIWTPNQLRHTAATEIRKQYGIEGAQVICGHQSADVTQVYAERDLKLAIQIAKEVG